MARAAHRLAVLLVALVVCSGIAGSWRASPRASAAAFADFTDVAPLEGDRASHGAERHEHAIPRAADVESTELLALAEGEWGEEGDEGDEGDDRGSETARSSSSAAQAAPAALACDLTWRRDRDIVPSPFAGRCALPRGPPGHDA